MTLDPVNKSELQVYRTALSAIWDRSGYDRGFISNPFAGDDEAKRGLARTRAVLDSLESPDARVPLIHVAGSKGKGSTTVLIDAIMRASGKRSGRFTSPHLHSYRERFVVDDHPISETDFASLTDTIMKAVRKVESTTRSLGTITAWELSTAMACEWFYRAGCDVAVIEVGLGGTLDATNVIDPLVSVITRLDLEHTAILGDTLPEIASNKAGIIKPGRPSVTVHQPLDALQVLEERARDVGSDLLVQGRDWTVEGDEDRFAVTGPWGQVDNLRTSLIGQHQVENAALAVIAAQAAFSSSASVPVAAIRAGLIDAQHPGRFEIVRQTQRPIIVIDGAHTPIAATSLAAALHRHFPGKRITMIVGMLDDKQAMPFLTQLVPSVARWIATQPDSPRAMPVASLTETLASSGQNSERAASVAEALDLASREKDHVIVVTGSLSTVADARVHLGLAIPDPPPR